MTKTEQIKVLTEARNRASPPRTDGGVERDGASLMSQCQHARIDNQRCRRPAARGSSYCWQHQQTMTELRDHSQPCEHVAAVLVTRHNGNHWACGMSSCPGGRVVTIDADIDWDKGTVAVKANDDVIWQMQISPLRR